MAQIRRAFRHLIGNIHVDLNTGFMGDGRKMEHGICGASQRHVNSERIHECILCHDITGADVLPQKLHDLHPGMLCQAQPVRINSRNRAVSGKPHPKRFRQAVHAVGRIHPAAASAGRTDLAFILGQLLIRQLMCRIFAHRFKHGAQRTLPSIHMPRHHGTAGDKDRRNVNARCRHQKAGNVLIAVRHHDQRVKLVRLCHAFRRIRDQIPCHKGILHAFMSHGDPVAYGDRGKHPRNAAGHRNTHPDSFHNLIDIHMAGNDFIVRTDDPDQRLLHLLIRKAKRIEQRPVRSLLDSCLYLVTLHLTSPSKSLFHCSEPGLNNQDLRNNNL